MESTMFKKQSGFTLIELAIVLVIVGVLIGSFVGTLGARIDTTRRAEAEADLEIIKTALCPQFRWPVFTLPVYGRL